MFGLPLYGLRSRLLLLVFLTVIPAVVLVVFISSEQRSAASDRVYESTLLIARLASARQEDVVADARQHLAGLALLPEIARPSVDPEGCRRSLLGMVKPRGQYMNAMVADPAGNLVCSENLPRGLVSVADQRWFQRVMQTRQFTVGEYEIGRFLGGARLNFALPVLDETGNIAVVLSTSIDIAWLNNDSIGRDLPSGSFVAMVDRNGTVLVRQPEPSAWVGRPLSDLTGGWGLPERPEGVIEGRTAGGVDHVVAFTSLPGSPAATDLTMLVGVPRDVAFANVDRDLRQALLGLGLFLVVAVAGSWIGGDVFFLRRVNDLLLATQRLASGDLSARTSLPRGRGELGQLARAFDAMAASLETRQKEAQQAADALRSSEERYRALVESAGDAIHVKDREGRFLALNSEYARRIGRTKEEILGRTVFDLYSESLARQFADEDDRVLATGEPVYSERLVPTPEGLRLFDGRKVPLRDETGAIVGLVTISRDITARQQAEEALRQSETRYRTLVESVDDGVFVKDAQGRFIAVNSEQAKRMGRTKEEIIGHTAWEVYPPEFARQIEIDEAPVYAEGQVVDSEGEYPTVDGIRFRHVHKVPLRDESGNITGLVAISRDVTERRKLEEQIIRASRLEMAGRLAGQVAHDFNNLLSPLLGYPEMIKARLPEGHPAIRFCESMQRVAMQMAAINEDLLALGRRGRAGQEIIDPNRLVEHLLQQMGATQEELTIETQLASGIPDVQGSAAQLMRVLSNLVTNAREAMPGGGTLLVSTSAVHLKEPTGQYNRIPAGDYVRFSVSDTGSGIRPDVLDHIFDPFFTTKHGEGQRGSGLGLSVVQGIVEDHRGAIDVETVAGRGTTFSVYLPAVTSSRPASDPARPDRDSENALPGGSERILLVDDDTDHREVAKEMLSTLGYRVDLAASGEEALERLQQNGVDLLLLDMIMPGGIDGTETYRRALEITPGLPAVIVSGYAASRLVEEARRLGAGTYLRKPVTLERLARTVRQVLDSRAQA